MTDKQNKKGSSIFKRINLFIFLFICLLLVILTKLFNIQVLNSTKYKLAAKKQYESRISLNPLRGLIYDRKLNRLVSNVNMYSFAADPNMVDNKDSVASLFASVFSKEKSYYLDKLNTPNTSFVWLERKCDPKLSVTLENLNMSGIIKINEPHRVYNYERLASQIIGSTNVDNIGNSGIEYQCNDMLTGTSGYVVMQKDGLGRKRPAVEYPRTEPVNGQGIVLTIDMNIQKIVEEELENAVTVNNAAGGKCIVMAVKTGEILGMYSYTDPLRAPEDTYAGKLTVITDLYEPGSTFKIVTASASLEEGIENKNDIIQTQGGEYSIHGLKITDSHKFMNLSFQQVIEQSSNVGMIKVSNKLGQDRFYKYSRDFGFGITTGIDLPGEIKGNLKKPIEFSPVSLNFMAIGYEVLVTALQMTNAYACLANNGVLMKPYVISKILSDDGTILKQNAPVQIRTVVSKNTSRTLTELLTGVVERGTGVEAKLENIRAAGKTGTAQKLVNGQYSKSSYTSSFIGYFPAENPQIVISVIIDSPSANEYYGGKVAAPIFKNIAQRIINTNGLLEFEEPRFASNKDNDVQEISENPKELNVVNMQVPDALKLLKEKNIEYKLEGNEDGFISSQKIISGKDGARDKLVLTVSSGAIKKSPSIPDLKGLSLRKALYTASTMDIDLKVSGVGEITKQEPVPGSLIPKNRQVIVYCEK